MASIRNSIIVSTTFLMLQCAAHAGGFNRGSANLDFLYGDGFSFNSGVTFVAPGRSYESLSGVVRDDSSSHALKLANISQSDVEFGSTYIVPHASLGGNVMGDLNCGGSYAQPYGVKTKFDGAITYHVSEETMSSHEFGLTCGYGYDLTKGRLTGFFGAFHEQLNYSKSRNFNAAFGNTGDSVLELESGAFGWRAGIGYEIPQIALRVQADYRSATHHDMSGNYTNTPMQDILNFGSQLAAASGDAAKAARAAALATAYGGTTSTAAKAYDINLPQQASLSVRTGINAKTLLFGSIKWTDWSVMEQLIVKEGLANSDFSTSNLYLKDGWTLQAGAARRLKEDLAVSASLTWDKGVSSGWDTFSDTWTLSAGASYDPDEQINIRAGAALLYLTEGKKTNMANAVDYTATSPNEIGFAGQMAVNIKF